MFSALSANLKKRIESYFLLHDPTSKNLFESQKENWKIRAPHLLHLRDPSKGHESQKENWK